jgi:heterodisulfide reductase subunit D
VTRPSKLTLTQLVELDACTSCGECVRSCQAYSEANGDLGPPVVRLQELKRLVKSEERVPLLSQLLGPRRLTEGEIDEFSADVFRCTLCARCVAACPVRIDLRGLWLSAREELIELGHYPRKLDQVRQAIAEQHNVVNYPNEERSLWVDYMADPPADGYQRPRAEVVYFVGCIASFSPAAQSIPEAFVQVLTKAGVDFTILGEREHCCGFPLIAAGMREEAEALKRHNVEMIREVGAKTVVFTCPSCYLTWRTEYQASLPDVELVHSSQLILRLIKEGRLQLKSAGLKLTYHDPCDLGRNAGEFEAPRSVLHEVPDSEFVEARPNRDRGLCCGGGGDLEVSDPNLAASMAARSLGAFEATGADVLITACQQCKRMFQAAKEKRGARIGILDLAELVQRIS